MKIALAAPRVAGIMNTIHFAGVNCAFRHPESATCVIDPSGECTAQTRRNCP